MITILIVDDSEDKIIQITKTIQSINVQADVVIASDIINAKEILNLKRVDLMVLDQYLPLRLGDEVNLNGGVELIKELHRDRLNNIPRSIFGLSVAEQIDHSYFWPFHTHNDENIWIKPFKSLVQYTTLYIKRYGEDPQSYLQSIILEGITDYLVLNRVMELFFQKQSKFVQLSYEKGSGWPWVVRQLFAKVFTLPKRKDGSIIKCVPLFDNDLAGNKAIEKINVVISDSQAERKHFKIFRYKASYSPILKCLKDQITHVTLEDFYPPKTWIWAFNAGILTKRDRPAFILTEPSECIIDACKMLEPNCEDDSIRAYLNIFANYFIGDNSKKIVAQKFISEDLVYLENAAIPLKYLLTEIFQYLEVEEI